jgi:hypothetical protein
MGADSACSKNMEVALKFKNKTKLVFILGRYSNLGEEQCVEFDLLVK